MWSAFVKMDQLNKGFITVVAIYHLTVKVMSRRKGQSAVACAAYRRADRLFDERLQRYQDYTDKPDVVHSEIVLPQNAPGWCMQLVELHATDKRSAAEKFWNCVETHEKRIDSRFAREVEFALPIELNQERAIFLAREFIHDQFALRGMAADWSVHWDKGNPHVHVMLTTRALSETGFGDKVRAWNDKSLVIVWRQQWAEYINFHLRLHGHLARVDHRSYKNQGIDLIPSVHHGKAVTDMERRGKLTELMKDANATRLANLKRVAQKPEILLDKIAAERDTFTTEKIVQELGRYINDKGLFAATGVAPDALDNANLLASAHTTQGALPENATPLSVTAEVDPATGGLQADAIRAQALENFDTLENNPALPPVLTPDFITAILKRIEHHESAFTEQELAKALMPYTAHADFFAQAMAKIKASDELIFLGLGEDGRDHYTTRRLFQLENQLQDYVDVLRQRKAIQIRQDTIDKLLRDYQQQMPGALSDEQTMVVRHVLSSARIACIVGRAGTGKSYSLGAARHVWEANNMRVLGVALSGIAAEALEKGSGIPSRTVESFRYALAQGYIKLNRRDVVVLDEAGMVDSASLHAILHAVVRSGAKIVLAGDPDQLQPIGPGAPFRALLERIGFAEIAQIRRQKGWQADATGYFSQGRVEEALDLYDTHQCIHFAKTAGETIEALVQKWQPIYLQDPRAAILLTYSNEDVMQLNQAARNALEKAGHLQSGVSVATAAGALSLSRASGCCSCAMTGKWALPTGILARWSVWPSINKGT